VEIFHLIPSITRSPLYCREDDREVESFEVDKPRRSRRSTNALHRIASHRVTRKREREREGEGRGEREERRKEKEIEQCQPEVEWSTDVEDEDEDEDENDGDGGDEDEDDVDEIRQGEWADARRAGKQHRSSSRAFRGRDNSACYSAHAPVIHVLSQLLRPPRSLGALGPRRLARRGRYSPV